MAEGNQHITDIEQFRRYERGELSYDEQHLFEKKLMEDALFRDAYDGFVLMDSDRVTPERALIFLDDALRLRIGDRTRRFSPVWVYAAAASVVLVVSWFIFFNRFVTKNISVLKPKEPTIIAGEPDQELVAGAKRSGDSALTARALVTKPSSPKTKHKTRSLAGTILSKDNRLVDNLLNSSRLDRVVLNKAENDAPFLESETGRNISESFPSPVVGKPAGKEELTDSGELISESNRIQGRVLDASGQRIPGVAIRAPKTYAITDSSGDFSIIKPAADSISLSYIGYKSKKVAIDQMNLGEIRMEEDPKMLEEMVVVGYGSQTRKVLAPYKLVKPSPAGGWSSYRRYLHQKAPGEISGKVRVTFMVRYDGSLSGLFATGNPELTKAAIEIVKNGPSWKPASGEYLASDSTVITVTVDFYK